MALVESHRQLIVTTSHEILNASKTDQVLALAANLPFSLTGSCELVDRVVRQVIPVLFEIFCCDCLDDDDEYALMVC
jgi:hypothetical protein